MVALNRLYKRRLCERDSIQHILWFHNASIWNHTWGWQYAAFVWFDVNKQSRHNECLLYFSIVGSLLKKWTGNNRRYLLADKTSVLVGVGAALQWSCPQKEAVVFTHRPSSWQNTNLWLKWATTAFRLILLWPLHNCTPTAAGLNSFPADTSFGCLPSIQLLTV